MTAVEWLEEKAKEFVIDLDLLHYFEQAKEMEKQQIIDAYKKAEDMYEFFEYEHRYGREYLTAEPYYNETFKNK
jgi:hypothetical protein